MESDVQLALEEGTGLTQTWSVGELAGLIPLFWQLGPIFGGLLILRCLPLAERVRATYRSGQER